jgi:flagellar hook-associated protein FlgK
MADLNHKTKAELAQQIEDLNTQMQRQKNEHDQLMKRATDKIAAYEQQMDMLNREINRLNVMLRELMNQRDQARQALVEGTINSNRLVHYVQPQQAVNI